MKYDEILSLLDRGLTFDQISELIKAPAAPAPAPAAAPAPAPAPAPAAAPAPAPAAPTAQDSDKILDAIDKLTKAVQASAIYNSQQPNNENKEMTVDSVMSDLIKGR